MEARWVEGNGKSIFLELVGDLECLVDVVPDLDSPVLRACCDELLSDADIETSNLLSVEAAMHEVEARDLVSTLVEWNVNLDDLIALGSEVDVVFRVTQAQ